MIEIISARACARPRAALFDFDGTLSLVRSGWQRIMTGMMVDILLQAPRCEAPDEIRRIVAGFVDQLTGRATIEQMERLCTEVAQRGGRPDTPQTYKERYLALLDDLVEHRLAGLRRGEPPDSLLVPGAREVLAELHRRGVLLVLASGTDRASVLREAAALKIDAFFGAHIYAPGPEYPGFSKREVIARLMADERLSGAGLVAFGDGPVEIAETWAVGGCTVGIAFDEERGEGIDARKRALLIRAGADLIATDFTDLACLLGHLGMQDS